MSIIGNCLPPGWTKARIDDLFATLEDGRTLHQGWSPQCEKVPSLLEDEWAVLKTTAIQAGAFLPEYNKRLPSKLAPRPLTEVKVGDILITCAGPRIRCGIACLVRHTRRNLMMSGKIYRFRAPENYVDSRYLEAFLQSAEAQDAIDRMKTGGSESGLNLTHDRFRCLEVPVAPINEQRRIADKYEELLSDLDAGVAELKAAQKKLAQYRQSLLKAAVEGTLTAEWRKKNKVQETGAQLLTHILAERRQRWEEKQLAKFKEQGKTPPKDWQGKYPEPVKPDTTNLPKLPDGWVWASVDQCSSCEDAAITDGPFGSNLKSAHYTESGPRVVRLKNIGEGVFVDAEVHISEDHYQSLKKHAIEAEDVVVAMLGEDLPRACLIPDGVAPGIVKADCARIRVNRDALLPDFLNNCLNSQNTKQRVSSLIKGIGRPRINLSHIRGICIPLPSLTEQTQIVSVITMAFDEVSQQLEAIQISLKQSAAQRKNILKSAFSGQLVPQDPHDEPASVLLERIRAEREERSTISKNRKLTTQTRRKSSC